MKRALAMTISTLALIACSPELKEKEFAQPKKDFKPNYEDVDLRTLHNIANDKGFKGSIEFSGTYGHGSLFRFSENLFILGKQFQRPLLISLAEKSRQSLQGTTKNQTASEKSTYVDFLISKSRAPVVEGINKINGEIKNGENQVVDLITDFNKTFSNLQEPMNIKAGIAYMKSYLSNLVLVLDDSDVMAEIKKGLQDELKVKITWLDSLGVRIDNVLADGNNFPTMLDRLFVLLEQEKIQLPADVIPMIEQAKSLGEGLRDCKTPQDAMTVIVDVWLLLDEKDRKVYFQEISPELYKELSGASKKTIACLHDEDCKGFFRKLKKNLFILPALKSFGPEKICQEIDVNAQIFIKNTLNTEITKILVNAPATIPGEVSAAIGVQRGELEKISQDYNGFFRTHFASWAKNKEMSSISILANGRKSVDLSGHKLSFVSNSDSEDIFESFGPSIAATVLSPKADLKSAFEILNRMTRVSDIVLADKGVTGQLIAKDFRNANQAETLRGLSLLIRYFRDWESSSFDQTLAKVTAQDLIPEMDLKDVNQALFPKADLYALSLATAAQFVENFESEKSPLFLMDFDNKINFLDRKKADLKADKCAPAPEAEGNTEGALAGIVEIKDGKKETVVKTAHLARWIIALTDFYESLKDAEKSASVDLKTADGCGNVPLNKILESRKTLRQLIAGLSNFLSHKMPDERGFFAPEFDLKTMKLSADKNISVLDQALSIRALVAASEVMGIESYRFTAIDAYYKMNLHLFYPQQRFYQASKSDGPAQLPVVVETLRALSSIEPYLPQKSADQLRWIMEPWLAGLEKISF